MWCPACKQACRETVMRLYVPVLRTRRTLDGTVDPDAELVQIGTRLTEVRTALCGSCSRVYTPIGPVLP